MRRQATRDSTDLLAKVNECFVRGIEYHIRDEVAQSVCAKVRIDSSTAQVLKTIMISVPTKDDKTHRYSRRITFQDVLLQLLQLPRQVDHLIGRTVIQVSHRPYTGCVLLRLRWGELSDHQINTPPHRTAKPARPITQSHQPSARTTILNLRHPIRSGRSGRSGSIHSPSRDYSFKATTWLILRVFFVR